MVTNNVVWHVWNGAAYQCQDGTWILRLVKLPFDSKFESLNDKHAPPVNFITEIMYAVSSHQAGQL